MRLTRKGALALLVAAGLVAGGSFWLSQPEPIESCLADMVAKDQAADKDQPLLVAFGEAAELQGQHAVEFARDQFFNCTRYKVFTTAWPPAALAKTAYVELKNAPSFEYGRYRVLSKKDAPGLKEDELVTTARVMRVAGSLAEARKQLQACPALAGKDTDAVVDIGTLSEPYLTAVLWNMGLATTADEARRNAQQLASMTFEAAETPACSDKRLSSELKTLRAFKAGTLPGLPCHLEMVDGEPELNCN